VAERTAELEAANRELEAFSYSVSHDLRAPLRALNGFSRILLDDHAAVLPPEARRYLTLVADSADQMSRLVDGLLGLSRLSRQGMDLRTVEPAELVARVLRELPPEETAGRYVDFVVGELPPCLADPTLLKQVFANLIGNAIKFTRTRPLARIEVGVRTEAGETVYYVRDNGVGFDPRYADRLFGVFQRLHRAEDYEGSGIGLATVERIVHRLGGRIWAESTPGRGATFSFTIGGTAALDGRDGGRPVESHAKEGDHVPASAR